MVKLTERQVIMFNFILEHPYVCYECLGEYLPFSRSSINRRIQSLWKSKGVIDKWKNIRCSICNSNRMTVSVKQNIVQELTQGDG